MEDIIHLLPDSVANQIAAGEVVQRPSSIIKEMVENSIDAGAQNIQVLVVDGGKTSVQIIDDGKGMSETDARMAFERHATSKIQKAADLFALTTMGFRGEALASIAAVAQVELKTRRTEDELGTYIQIAGSKIENQEPTVCSVGSNFAVKNLFFNVPARRKFLKSNQTELTNVVADFQRIVLVHPDIAFTLYNNGTEMFNLPKASVRQRIIDIFGKKINSDLLPIEVETSLASITGYIGKPETSKKKGAHQYFFVNGRYMRNPYFHSAVMRAYDNLIPVGEHVSYFIYFSVDPQTIDVNVHPTKTEIKFDNEQPIWQVLTAAVRESIGKFCAAPMIDFDVEGKPDIPVIGATPSAASYNQFRPVTTSYNPFAGSSSGSKQTAQVRQDGFDGLDDAGGSGARNTKNNSATTEPLEFSFDNLTPSSLQPSLLNVEVVPVSQIRNKYILCKDKDGLLFIDQHRAHIRIRYEQNMHCMEGHSHPSQRVLFPELVQFTKAEDIVVYEALDRLEIMGFEMTSLGGGSYSVLGIPSGLEGMNVDAFLHDIATSLLERTDDIESEMSHTLALSLAKSSAMTCGQSLTLVEMEKLVKDLFSTSEPALTPEGQNVLARLSLQDIERLF